MNTAISIFRWPSRLFARRCAWATLLLLLVSNAPHFLGTRLNADATYFDLQAECVRKGGVLYRDMLEPNFPGVVWIHTMVRGVAGGSSWALRAFDLAVLLAIVAILLYRRRSTEPNRASAAGACLARSPAGACLALSVCWFYLSLSTWAHCQRDTWMLLFALGALVLRDGNMAIVSGERQRGMKLFRFSFLEGMLWACAFWIKPHVAVPALFVLAVSAAWSGFGRQTVWSFAAILAGGVSLGVVGSGWLIATGAWPYFWETQLQWNPEYLSTRFTWKAVQCHAGVLEDFAPWSLAHVVALPVAVLAAGRSVIGSLRSGCAATGRSAAVLPALYLGWSLQLLVLQHPFSYPHVPAIILAMAVIAGVRWPADWHVAPHAMTASVFLAALLLSPVTDPQRWAFWMDIGRLPARFAAGTTRDMAQPGSYWAPYPPLLDFLRDQEVRDEDVLVYSSMLIPVYRDLNLRPPTRFVLTDVHCGFFPSRGPEIRSSIARSAHRFIVTDLSGFGLSAEELERINPRTGLPAAIPAGVLRRFPWTQPVIFRSSWFVVHAARDTAGQ